MRPSSHRPTPTVARDVAVRHRTETFLARRLLDRAAAGGRKVRGVTADCGDTRLLPQERKPADATLLRRTGGGASAWNRVLDPPADRVDTATRKTEVGRAWVTAAGGWRRSRLDRAAVGGVGPPDPFRCGCGGRSRSRERAGPTGFPHSRG
ncbi:hypothetical protein J0H58_30480 [bacterium]|nr:hypothetical protein [bacterium]